MKRLMLCVLLQTIIGCSDGKNAGSGPFTAHIIATDGSNYDFRDVTFSTLTNLDNVEGEVTSVLGDAALNADAGIDEFISPNAQDSIYLEKGKRVRLDYLLKDGVVYPKNFDSMAMLAMYYNYEKTVLFWQENLNLDLSAFGLLRMFYAPRVKRQVEGISVEGSIKINAAFLPGPRDFFFFKTSPVENLPINMNFGVMAHEFSHAIFDYQFAEMDATVYETDFEQSQTRLRAVNEGVADYFSYMVTQRVEEFGDSLESLGTYRTLPVSWTISNVGSSGCLGGAYCEGSLLASALYEVVVIGKQDPVVVGLHVFNALPLLRTSWLDTRDNDSFDYHYILNDILDQVAGANQDISPYCQAFFKYFDSSDLQRKLTRCSN